MPVTEQQVLDTLRSVKDPEVFRDIVALNQVKNIKICEGMISVEVATPSQARDKLRRDIHAALGQLPGVEEIFINFAAASAPVAAVGHRHAPPPQPPAPRGIPGVKHVIAVGAGKGGVGKSTVAVNLALALAISGKKTAILDGDVYGPSVPTLTGLPHQSPGVIGEQIIPFYLFSKDHPNLAMPVMSIGFMVDKEKAMIARGPILNGMIKQLLGQVDWSGQLAPPEVTHIPREIDYLIVDLPPGTGDVSLTLAQTVPLTGAVIVATPQEVALADARRAVRMFQQLAVEILGVVENMSHFVCDHGTAYDIFGRGGAKTMAQQMGLPFLGELPIHTALRQNSDAGTPFANFAEKSPSRQPLLAMADLLDKQVAVRMATRPSARPINLQIS